MNFWYKVDVKRETLKEYNCNFSKFQLPKIEFLRCVEGYPLIHYIRNGNTHSDSNNYDEVK